MTITKISGSNLSDAVFKNEIQQAPINIQFTIKQIDQQIAMNEANLNKLKAYKAEATAIIGVDTPKEI